MKKGDLVCNKDKSVVGVVIEFSDMLRNVTIAVIWNEPPTAQGCKTFTLHNDNVILLPKGTKVIKHYENKTETTLYRRYDSITGIIHGDGGAMTTWDSKGMCYDLEFEFVDDVTTKNDNVNHPSHYTQGKIEVIDYIEDKKLGYHLGNVVKYVSRAGHKNNKLEDLKKARWYLDREIKNMEDKNEN